MSEEIVAEAAPEAVESSAEVVESSEASAPESNESESEISSVSDVQAETTSELQEEIQEAIEDGASEEEVKAMIKSFELKVNGKTFTKELDLSDEDAVKKELQMAYAGREAMQKSRELEKAYDMALEELKSNPAKFLQEMGMDFDELSYNHLKSLNEEMQKSPEELEKEQFQRELEEAREEARKLREEKEQIEYERVYAEQQKALNTESDVALWASKYCIISRRLRVGPIASSSYSPVMPRAAPSATTSASAVPAALSSRFP